MFGKKLTPVALALFVTLLVTLLAACIAPLPPIETNPDTLFQTSTLSSLSAGNFDGEMTIAELQGHGDFGLGTYNALDGEMVVLDGEFYQVRDDGIARLVTGTVQSPFAAVTFFAADQTIEVQESFDCVELQAHLDSLLPTLDAPYAIKISGEFSFLQVRAPHKESPPYPTLTDALADQVLFESQNISGTLVGFRLPDYLAGANAAGYHLHFLSHDRQQGGHMLQCQASSVTVEIDAIDSVYIDLAPAAFAPPPNQ